MSSVILKTTTPDGKHHSEYIICASMSHSSAFEYDPEAKATTQTIPRIQGTQALLDGGWVYTNSRKFAPPDKRGVWVCPSCACQHNWKYK